MAEVDFDAGAFASEATGTSAANHAEAEGAEDAAEASDSVGSRSTWREMLMRTEPEQRLADVEDPWSPERGGMTRVYRGLQKMTGVEGMPAIIDVVIGAAEFIVELDLEGNGDEDDAGDDGPTLEEQLREQEVA